VAARMKRVILDLDCVVGDFWGAALDDMNKYCGTNVSFHQIHKYDIRDIFDIEFSDFFKFIKDNNVLEKMKPYPKSVIAINSLIKSGYKIDIATARGYEPNAHSITDKWLRDNKIKHHSLTIIQSGENKSDLMKEISGSFDMAIDDLPENLIDFSKSGIAKKLVLINQPWNQEHNHQSQLNRHKSLSHFVNNHLLSNTLSI
jgi:uncharacterized HAD superfamily protein